MPVAWAECTKPITLPDTSMLSVLSLRMLHEDSALIKLCISEPMCLWPKTGLVCEEIKTQRRFLPPAFDVPPDRNRNISRRESYSIPRRRNYDRR